MDALLLAFERLARGVVAAGGLVMATAVRPLLLAAQRPGGDPAVASAAEQISVGAWTRYNRLALIAALALAATESARLLAGGRLAVLYLCGGLVMTALLAVKLRVDATLAARARSGADARRGGTGTDLDRLHRIVELLSAPILIIAAALLLLPVPAR
ncbi:hypothetical protein AB0A69_12790 [Streptomyces sp. NPDC045431]|uniref:hypothetical protein n=1 Tax=Streptomyces sp. NPDC045431 TaxID=3155613 RepID=UPI0033C22EFA